ncbi:hypothetical protein A3B84_00255 [Candidatus Nomurabacteria bacterium RIFCSPHIGHO2_02_FULL_35_13]|uniref:Zinc-binding domain-containing protein n=1 Tax=Candidatus Nomurabacteria bacterium RIFCSPHIGHO2_02_FULL_35_13 TaxID=1801748 RepID=A0A1F6VPU1_9BACT|nr:MAG: hypothetical protein A3B84_00255 [Candidatus Nomurabacteria bacterium RIFCSPHIGHO2_02_FULL_35_13]
MKSETKICQNCKKDFTIDFEDFKFYEKIKVPPPTFCPECRLTRRLVWRNEKILYRRICNLCNKNIISMYHASVPFPVYCRECWLGDQWDPTSYGREYDMSRPFFEQYKEFSNTVPRLMLWQRNAINSDYSNHVGEAKNVYLSTSVVMESENIFYSKCIDHSKDIIDCLNVINGSESLYETVEAQGNYNSQYLLLCRNCMDSYYSIDCINCNDCILSYNLRNKKFCIRNKQYSKEEYFKELEKFNLKSRVSRNILLEEFKQMRKKAIYRFGNINKATNSTGNNLLNVKNCKNCFEVYNMENCSYCFRAFGSKDCMDMDFAGTSELLYDYMAGAMNDYNVRFSYSAMDSVRDADYTESCRFCTNIFGCISLRNAENAIFNKIYSKEEFIKLKSEIIKQMSTMPFIDKAGRKYEYGEFFPIEVCTWAYNETAAQEFFPITKEEARKNGYPWREPDAKNFDITIPAGKIPDNIDDVNENILKEVLGCAHEGNCDHQCNIAFRLTDYELKFYKKHDIPLPIFCPNCRHYERFKIMPSLKLWKRNCMCDKSNHDHKNHCQNEFETAYAPNRPEMVYCEKCYQKEVY